MHCTLTLVSSDLLQQKFHLKILKNPEKAMHAFRSALNKVLDKINFIFLQESDGLGQQKLQP